MNLAKVWNDNDLPFKQKFKDDLIEIPAKGFIEMEYEEAMAFKSFPYSMKFDGMGQQTKDSYKMIRVEGKPVVDNVVTAYKCHADGSLHASKEALNNYVQGLTASQKVADEDAPMIRRPGRPKKEEIA